MQLSKICRGCVIIKTLASNSRNLEYFKVNRNFSYQNMLQYNSVLLLRACGLMDKASVSGVEDCRFESCHARFGWALPLDHTFRNKDL